MLTSTPHVIMNGDKGDESSEHSLTESNESEDKLDSRYSIAQNICEEDSDEH